jgi:hypothetical protein
VRGKGKLARYRDEKLARQVKKLASFGLSGEEIAVCVECSRDYIYKQFSTVLKAGHELRNSSLRRKQFEVAMEGHPTMLIWLGKQYLDQRDKNEVTGVDGQPLQMNPPVFNINFIKASELKPHEPAQLTGQIIENGDGNSTVQ